MKWINFKDQLPPNGKNIYVHGVNYLNNKYTVPAVFKDGKFYEYNKPVLASPRLKEIHGVVEWAYFIPDKINNAEGKNEF